LAPTAIAWYDRFARGLGTAENIDDVDRYADLREVAPHIFAMDVLAGDLRIDRQHPVTVVLKDLHDAVGRPVWTVGCPNHGNGASVPQ
jgi:hypothetical protein